MKSYAFSLWLALTFLAACFFGVSCPAFGQSLTSGGVTGTVTDPSGAAVPNATVTLKNNDTGAAASVTSNDTGAYRFALLNPGSYNGLCRRSRFFGSSSERVRCRRTVIHGERET